MSQVIYVTGYSITLYETHRRGAQAIARFPCNEVGYSDLVQQLNQGELKPVAILVDLIEEEFREESLVHTIGRDRTHLHARHSKKLFRATPFRHHRVIGRQNDGRRDDKILFSALTNRDNIEPLLAALKQARVPVKGIYSLPIITDRLLSTLSTNANNILVVTQQPDGGLRETFLRNGRVHFSRLAPINDSSPADYCHIVSTEAAKTRRYLISLRLLPPTQPLDVYVLCDSARFKALQAMADDESDITIHPVSLVQVATQLGFNDHENTPFSDALFCYLLRKKLTRNHYAPASQLRHWQTYKTTLGLRVATWLIAVGSITLAGMNVVDSRVMQREITQLEQLTEQTRHSYQISAKSLTIEPEQAFAMREAIKIADRLNAYPLDLDKLFTLLGASLGNHSNVILDTFEWFVTTSKTGAPADSVSANNRQTALVDAPYLVSNIKAHLRDFDGRYRRAHEQIDSIVQWLENQPGITSADVIGKPLNTRTDSDLQGGIARSGDEEEATFELRIIMELSHESA